VLKEKDFALFCHVFMYYTTGLRVSAWSDSDTPSRTCFIGMKSMEQLIQLVPVRKFDCRLHARVCTVQQFCIVMSMCKFAQIIYLRGGWMCVWNLCYALVLWCDIYLRTGWMCVQYLCYAAGL